MGKVSLPHSSGVLTISLVIPLHDLQTDAQKRRADRAGHDNSLSSTLRMISRRSSGGKFAHCPCSIWSERATSGTICDRVLLLQCFLSVPLLDIFPIPSFISLSSRTMLFKDISINHINCNFPSNGRVKQLELCLLTTASTNYRNLNFKHSALLGPI